MKRHGIQKNIHIDIINGIEDHVHCLFRSKPTQSPSNLIRNIKGESSHWINEQKLTKEKFQWQEGYGIFSVSQKDIEKIRSYIFEQESHHKTIDYENEIRKLI